ncbi:MAG: hypothetical protein PHS14_02870 [Elusimicrobia bacterium]|nr:hypothetical protein [Elusimicrobiota bacterium]
MPTILTVDEVREHIETDLGDDPLTRLIEAADQEIIDRLGALASHTEVLNGDGLPVLPLARRASAISSATEKILDTDYALSADDYELLGDGYALRRKQGTSCPALSWRGSVTVVYVPIGGAAGELAARKKLLVDLVRLDVAYDAKKSDSLGDSSRESLDHGKERDSLFSRVLNRNRRLPLA